MGDLAAGLAHRDGDDDSSDGEEHIRDLDGVREAETWSHLRFVKETYASLHLGVD